MDSIFFDHFVISAGGTVGVQQYALTYLPPLVMIYRRLYRGHHSWPFNLIIKLETADPKEPLRKYLPRSDLLVYKSSLPRLLVEVNSAPRAWRPEDLTRMLLCGAVVVRFANKFLDKFMEAKDFVLLAIYLGRWQSNSL